VSSGVLNKLENEPSDATKWEPPCSKHNTTHNNDGRMKMNKSRTHSSLDIFARRHVFERDTGIVVFPRKVGKKEA